MRKSFAAVLIAVLCILMFSACIGETLTDKSMRVVKCEDWVSLREAPDTHSARLAKVPLGAVAENCSDAGNGFISCTYCGVNGYILAEYLTDFVSEELLYGQNAVSLETLTREEENKTPLLTWKSGGYQVLAVRENKDGCEVLTVGCYTADGMPVWSKVFADAADGQFLTTDCFIGGEIQKPYLLVSTSKGMTAMEILSGKDIWQLGSDTVRTGGGIVHLVDPAGNIYLTGYDGPPPVCVNKDGHLMWTSSIFNDDIYWPYSMDVLPDGLHVRYDSPCGTDPDSRYEACFNLTTGEMEYYDIVSQREPEGMAEIIPQV